MLSTLTHLFTPKKSNNQRPLILHPAGLTILIAIFLLVQSSLELLKTSHFFKQDFVLGFASSITPNQVIDQTNARRLEAGLVPLRLNAQLTQAAIGKANHMFINNYWAHIAPDGTTPWIFIRNAGYRYSVAGENLARDFDTTEPMVEAWMNSATHRDNILNPRYQDIGVAVVNGTLRGVETTLVVQMFGTSGISAVTTPTITSEVVAAQPAESMVASLPEEVAEDVTVIPQEGLPMSILSRSSGEETAMNLISPLMLTKVLATSMVMLLVIVLLYDSLVTHKRKTARLVGRNMAHISFLGFLLLIIYSMTQGVII